MYLDNEDDVSNQASRLNTVNVAANVATIASRVMDGLTGGELGKSETIDPVKLVMIKLNGFLEGKNDAK